MRLLIQFGLYISVMFSQVEAAPMTFTQSYNGGNCDECSFIVAEGDIIPSTVDKFRELNPTGGKLLLNSNGGHLLGAIALGNEFRRRNIEIEISSTERRDGTDAVDEVPGVCESACAYAFFGGVKRSIPQGSKLGIHALAAPSAASLEKTYSDLEITNVQIQVGVVLEYTQRMGVDPVVVQWASEVPNDDMRYLNGDEMRSLRITWNPRIANAFRLEPYKSGLIARSESSDAAVKATFLCLKKDLLLIVGQPPLSKEVESTFRAELEPEVANLVVGNQPGALGDWLKGSMTTRRDKNGVYRTVAITEAMIAGLTANDWASFSMGSDRASGMLNFFIQMPTKGLPEMMRLIKRNCI